ncbi:MAG: transposase, partial [Anaerolineales bacterium]
QRHNRRSIRLKGYDYTSPGSYFVTICTQDRVRLFGEVVDAAMQLNPYGRVVDTYLSRIPDHFPHVTLGAWVVMPNHVHAIITITAAPDTDDDPDGKGDAILDSPSEMMNNSDVDTSSAVNGDCGIASPLSPTQHPIGAPSGSLGAIVGNFKSIATRRINRMRHTPGADVWQRNYWEHIIRSRAAHQRITAYIHNNPARWEEDRLHPDAP